MIRAKYNPAYPYHVTMAKHAPYVSTAKSVKGHETRPDGRAIAVDTGYQSNFRYGAQQSFTRSWLMPMHQTDSLRGKHAIAWKFKWGYAIDTMHQHDSEGMLDPHHEGGRRRHRSAWALGASPDRVHAGSGKRVHDQVAQRGAHQDQGLSGGRVRERLLRTLYLKRMRTNTTDHVRRRTTMPEVYNWQLGRKMLYPYEERHPKWQFAFVFNINRCLACQTCSMADKSTWLFSKGQEYMWWNNVETKPYGGYPQFYDVKITQLIEQVNPGGQVWNVRVGRKHHAPYGVFEGMTIFDAGAKVGQAAIGYIPTDQEWRFVNIYEDTATSMRAMVENIDKSGFTRDEPWRLPAAACRNTRRTSSICSGSVTTARIRAVWRPARGRRSTSGRKTALC